MSNASLESLIKAKEECKTKLREYQKNRSDYYEIDSKIRIRIKEKSESLEKRIFKIIESKDPKYFDELSRLNIKFRDLGKDFERNGEESERFFVNLRIKEEKVERKLRKIREEIGRR